MVYRRHYRLRVLGDLLVLILLTTCFTLALVWLGLKGSAWMRTAFAPLTGSLCSSSAPAPTATRFADLWGDWSGLGAPSWSSALRDAFSNELATSCTGVADLNREAFLNATDRLSRAARKALHNAPPPGVRTELDRIRIEQMQLASLNATQKNFARFALNEAERLLAQPESTLVQNVADVSGLTDVKNQFDTLKNALSASGLYNVLGGGDLLGQLESKVTSQVTSKIMPTKLFLPHKVLLEPTPPLAVLNGVKHIDGTLVGLAVTLIVESATGSYSAQRLWLTMEIETRPKGQMVVKRWLTRPL